MSKATLVITLAIGLSDKTWFEKDVEIEDNEGFWDDTTPNGDGLNYSKVEEAAFAKIPEQEADKLAPSFWKLIHWEWKSVKDEYEGGLCPDCQQVIPDDAAPEESCTNCGHVWSHSTKVQG
jgi:hypothetical protein